MVQEVDHASAGRIKLTGIPVKFSDTKPTIRLAPPMLGQHTTEVLKEVLGYSEARIRELKRTRVIY